MKTFLIITLCLSSNVCCAQIVEQFSDGDFTSAPHWSGSAPHFIVNPAGQLQLNNTVAGTSYLSTAFEASTLDGFEWEVFVRQSFSPSGSNYGRIYLVSSQANLTGPLNGYYLQLGEGGSTDAVELFKQAGTVHTSVCRAANATIASSFAIRIKVKNQSGHWTLSVDYSGGTSFVEQAQGTDSSFTSSGFFGVVCVYTAANAGRFFFDDFIAGPPLGDLTPPTLTSVTVASSSELLLAFSESIDPSSSTTLTNFEAGHGLGNPVSALRLNDQKSIKLTFSSAFVNGRLYQLSISGIRDVALNEKPPGGFSFRYFIPEPPVHGDIVFNELLSDPSPIVGLPAFEFVELYNKSAKAFDLGGWKLNDLTSSANLPGVFILPGEHIIVTATAALGNYEQFGSTIALSDMPTLNNSFDALTLKDPSGQTIDSLHYFLSWFQDEDKQQGGYSLERLDPSLPANEALNWMASIDSLGGTPGSTNSVFGRNPDSKPPNIDSLVVVNQKELMLCFNEALDTTSSQLVAGYIINEEIMPHDVQLSELHCVSLRFDGLFENGVGNNLHVAFVKDVAGNEMLPTDIPFLYFVPGEVRPGVVRINEIMADPTPTVHLPEAEFIEVVNTTSEPYDLGGWTLSDATSVAVVPHVIILPEQHIILTSTTNAGKFHAVKTVAVTGFPSLANGGEPLTLRAHGMKVDSLYYLQEWLGTGEKSDGGWSMERLSLSVDSNEQTNWRASVDSLGGTPGRVNSVAGMNPDSTPPVMDSILVRDNHELELFFSEPIDVESGTVLQSYKWSGLDPINVAVSEAGDRIMIHFAAEFPNGFQEQLSVSGLMDKAGNTMVAQSFSFMYFRSGLIARGAVLINEIMPDPAPVVQLPEAEFIEIVNNSTQPYDLSGWTLSDGTTTVRLPQTIIRPAEFLILTSTTNQLKFTDSVRVAGVTGFPSLNNTGEPLTLKAGDILIDSVHYNIQWLGDDVKQDGGWTLERLQYNFPSHAGINWRPSVDPRGGTPGARNSQSGKNPDDKSPTLLSAVAVDPRSIVLTFDEPLEPVQDQVSIALDSISCQHFELQNGSDVLVTLNDELDNGRSYRLTVSGVRDTAGNMMPWTERTLTYFIPSETRHKDVIITEIMADPSPAVGLPEAEYVELYNRSESPVNISGWLFADERGAAALPFRIVMPGEYIVLTASHLLPSGRNYLLVPGLPSLANEGEYLVLRTPDGRQIDSVNYSVVWLGVDDKREGGWSLELIDPRNPCGEEDNWAVSEDDSGGTPGRQNSVFASKPDLAGPRLMNAEVESPTSVIAQFDEKIDGVISPESFALVPERGTLTADFADASLRTIRITLSYEFKLSTPYQLTASKVYDCNGNLIQDTFSSLQFIVPEDPLEGDVVINEVLFNPRPGGPDFVEIYNMSSRYIDLEGWELVRIDGDTASIDKSSVLVPHSFQVLTPDPARLQSDYPKTVTANLVEVDLPSMPDDRAGIAIIDELGRTIDRIEYDENFHSTLIRDPEGVSLERISMSAGSMEASNWISAAESAGFATPGFLNSATRDEALGTIEQFSVSPEIVSSNGAGFAMIHYHFDEPGYIINCRILDQQGRLVREVANNVSAGVEGFLRWDADCENGSAARQGYYVVLIDYFNLSGHLRSVRMRVVIASG